MPASKRSRLGTTIAKSNRTAIENRVSTAQTTRRPFWGWSALALLAVGMLLLIVSLYQIVLHFGLSAAAAAAITEVSGPLGILYLTLRSSCKRSPSSANQIAVHSSSRSDARMLQSDEGILGASPD